MLFSDGIIVDAYFDSVDGRTPQRWPSTSLISFPGSSGHRDYKRIEVASADESRDKLNKSNGGPEI